MIENWEILPLLIGFILEYFLYTKYKFRAGGVIILPMLATYAIKYPSLVPTILLITLITYIVLEVLYSKFIIYGRRLLYLSLIIGIIISGSAALVMNNAPFTYAFLMPGLMAYNFHREKHSTVVKIKSTVLNTGVFLLLVIVCFGSLVLFI